MQDIPDNKKIECRACDLPDVLDSDLDPHFHKGFTVGKRGKVMYWYFVWHGKTTGNASIFTSETEMRRAYIKRDQLITVHFK